MLLLSLFFISQLYLMSNGGGLLTLYSVVGFELTSSVPSVIKDSVCYTQSYSR